LGRKENWRVVNSIFEEGANPLLRKIREGLDLIGFPSQEILKHGNKRVLFGVSLAENFSEVLLSIQKTPKYFIPQVKPRKITALLAKQWSERWLLNRIKNEEVLEAMSKHTLEYPITHDARVPVVSNEISLFD
jgi:hypothetical protein